jgi:hypothetical protein
MHRVLVRYEGLGSDVDHSDSSSSRSNVTIQEAVDKYGTGIWVRDDDGTRFKVLTVHDDDAIVEYYTGFSGAVPIKGPLARDDYRVVK